MVDTHTSVTRAAAHLQAGGVVALPTETVYGLFGRTDDVSALRRIYALKGRPTDNPLIAHVLDIPSARQLASSWPIAANALCEAFWPGPLTIVVSKQPSVPDIATAGLPTVAIRSPQHDLTRRVMEAVGVALSAPSANRSGAVSPTCAAHVREDYAGIPEAADLMVLDGGPCETGLESTVIDLSGHEPHLLRLGSVSIAAIEAVLGGPMTDDLPTTQAASPGTQSQHYAPRTPMLLIDLKDLAEVLDERPPTCVIGPSTITVEPPHRHLVMPDTHQSAAKALYSLLREADATNTTHIIVVRPPTGPAWRTIHDRLQRASV